MRKPLAFTLALFVASLFTAPVSLGQQGDRPQISNGPKIRALVYHETTGFRHASIPYAIEQLRAYGDANGIDITADQTSAHSRRNERVARTSGQQQTTQRGQARQPRTA